ncbi:MAG: hypothetical protein QOG77_222 [Solirubrobacteraceae bacterium]|nr:hypothetical protein [Solirubrobacteraceae bacterium]
MSDTPARDAARRRGRLDRRAVIGLLVVFALALAASRGCQQTQVRVSQQQAVASARERVDFTPQRTQVRLVRQGLAAHPYWAVSLSVAGPNGSFRRLSIVRVDANTGKVAAVSDEPVQR